MLRTTLAPLFCILILQMTAGTAYAFMPTRSVEIPKAEGVTPNSIVLSSVIELQHIIEPTDIKIAAAGATLKETLQYRICADTQCQQASGFISHPSKVQPGRYVQMRMRAPMQKDKVALGFLYVGDIIATWKVYTGTPNPEQFNIVEHYYSENHTPTIAEYNFPEMNKRIPGEKVTSEIMRIHGINGDAPIRIAATKTELEYRLCSDAECGDTNSWTTDPGKVHEGQYLQLRMQAPEEKNKIALGFVYIADTTALWRIDTGEEKTVEIWVPILEEDENTTSDTTHTGNTPLPLTENEETPVKQTSSGRKPLPNQPPWYKPLEAKEVNIREAYTEQHQIQIQARPPKRKAYRHNLFDIGGWKEKPGYYRPRLISKDVQRRIIQEMLSQKPQLVDHPHAETIAKYVLDHAELEIMGLNDKEFSLWVQQQTSAGIADLYRKITFQ